MFIKNSLKGVKYDSKEFQTKHIYNKFTESQGRQRAGQGARPGSRPAFSEEGTLLIGGHPVHRVF